MPTIGRNLTIALLGLTAICRAQRQQLPLGEEFPAGMRFPPEGAAGTANTEWRRSFPAVGSKRVSVHFRMLDPGGGRWVLSVTGANAADRWEMRGEESPERGEDFYSVSVRGSTAKVALSGDTTGLNLEISGILGERDRPQIQSLIGDPDYEEIGDYRDRREPSDKPFYKWSTLVGYLRVTEDGKVYPCSGFLITPTLLMTAGHCAGPKWKKIEIDFRFEKGYKGQSITTTARKKLTSEPQVDFAVFRLTRPVAAAASYPVLKGPAVGAVVSIQHPGPATKKLVQKNCAVQSISASGDVLHACDTEGGSSGSPFFDKSGIVVAIQTAGGCVGRCGPEGSNLALSSGAILTRLKDYPELCKELAKEGNVQCLNEQQSLR